MFTVARIRLGTMAAFVAAIVLPMSTQATYEQPSSASYSLVAQATHKSDCQKAVKPKPRIQKICNTIRILGHRMKEGPKSGTNENTMLALRQDYEHHVGAEIDTWMTTDGVSFVFHDITPRRVVDPATLPSGVTLDTRMDSLTWAQVSQMRTKGGEPIPRLKRVIRYTGRHGMDVIIEIKYGEINAPQAAAWVKHWHATHVSFYQTPKRGGSDHHILRPELTDYGIPVGVKYLGAARPTVEEMANAGYSFVVTSIAALTKSYVAEVHHYGLQACNFDSGQREVWIHMVNVKADCIIAPHPGKTRQWARGH